MTKTVVLKNCPINLSNIEKKNPARPIIGKKRVIPNSATAAWVKFLRNYGPIPTNDNMYDESIQRALRRHEIKPITLPSRLIDELINNFKSETPVSHIITGTAGDGKTYHCRELWLALGGNADEWDNSEKIKVLNIGNYTLTIVKDLSELKTEEGAHLIAEFVNHVTSEKTNSLYLLAANHGQLLEKFKSTIQTEKVKKVAQVVESLMVTGHHSEKDVLLRMDDLSRMPAAEVTRKIIDAIVTHEGWNGCKNCQIRAHEKGCSIYENRTRLMGEGGELFNRRLSSLIELSEKNGNHFPIRQLLALGANAILGHPEAKDGLMNCNDIPEINKKEREDLASIYRNVFGENLKPSRVEKTELFKKLNVFGIGQEASSEIDDLLIYGEADPANKENYQNLIAVDTIYGSNASYRSAQRSYLEGRDGQAEEAFLRALKNQRQRLFFTLPENHSLKSTLWNLTVYRHGGLFLETITNFSSGKTASKNALTLIIRGLNRAFTGMFVQNQDEVVLATSGSYSQSKMSPLLDELISVPRDNGEEVTITSDDGEHLYLNVKLVRGQEISPVRLRLTPIRFEFLARVAEGALPTSFSLECYEDILAFKSKLLRQTEARRKLNDEDASIQDEVILRFIDVGEDGRAIQRRIVIQA